MIEYFHIGRRGILLLFLSLIELIIGLNNIDQDLPNQVLENAHYLLLWVPLGTWFVIWTISGAISFLGAFSRKIEPMAFWLGTFLSMATSLGYFAAALFWHNSDRAWVSGLLYGGIAVINQVIAGWEDHSRKVR